MKKLLGVFKYIFWLLLVVVISGLGFAVYHLNKKIDTKIIPAEETSASDFTPSDSGNIQSQPHTSNYVCGADCQRQIAQEVAKAVATLSATTNETVVEKQTVVTQTTGGTDFIPMGTTFSTTSTSWVDVPDSTVYFDLINDYGEDATVSWEASLKVDSGSGKVFARLYDGTHNIAVDMSELSTESNIHFERVTTGNLPFWRGHNLYKVQIKSLNSFSVTYSGGKIKVSY